MHRAARPLQPGLPASPKPRDNVPRRADCRGSRTRTLLLVGTGSTAENAAFAVSPFQPLLWPRDWERTPTRGSSGILSDPAPTHLPGTRPPGLPPARLYHGEHHHRTPTSTAAAAQLLLPRRALLGRAPPTPIGLEHHGAGQGLESRSLLVSTRLPECGAF